MEKNMDDKMEARDINHMRDAKIRGALFRPKVL